MTFSVIDPTVYTNNANKPTDGAKLLADLNNIIGGLNTHDSEINTIMTGSPTLSGNITFSGSLTFSGMNTHTGQENFAQTGDPGSPNNGDFWYNSATNIYKGKLNGTVKTFATLSDIDSMLPNQGSANGEFLTSNGANSSWGTVAFTKFAQSSGITITSAGAWSFTHGLGMAPKGFQLFLKCGSAELNYTVGDMVPVSSDNAHGTSDLGAGVKIPNGSTTVISGRFGANTACFVIPDNTTGQNSFITNTKWTLVVNAWA